MKTAGLFTILALAVSAAAMGQATTQAPITLGKDTTIITAPLREDGWPDYVKALNERFGNGVTPENNGFVLFLQATGTEEGVFGEKSKAQTLQMAGATPALPGAALYYKDIGEYIRDRGIPVNNDGEYENELTAARQILWTAETYPRIAEYLKTYDAPLDIIVQAAMRPNWWCPSVSDDGTMMGVLLPSLGKVRSVANALAARATFRAKAGDFDGFLKDVIAIKHLARHFTAAPSLLERLVGTAVDTLGSVSAGAVAGSGTLTAQQCQTLAAALDALPPLGNSAGAIDTLERWCQLDGTRLAATYQWEKFNIIYSIGDDGQGSSVKINARGFDAKAVDWNLVLKRQNAVLDELVANSRAATLAEVKAGNAVIERMIQDWQQSLTTAPLPLRVAQHEGETREQYSERIARTLICLLMPSMGKAEELMRRAQLQHDSLRTLTAAAQVKATTGTWPATLAELPPGSIKSIPKDLYPIHRATEVKYRVLPQGALIYSIMENNIDDQGINDRPNKKDDLAVGVKP